MTYCVTVCRSAEVVLLPIAQPAAEDPNCSHPFLYALGGCSPQTPDSDCDYGSNKSTEREHACLRKDDKEFSEASAIAQTFPPLPPLPPKGPPAVQHNISRGQPTTFCVSLHASAGGLLQVKRSTPCTSPLPSTTCSPQTRMIKRSW